VVLIPPHWGFYFGTEDADATVETARAAGGQLLFGPMDIEPGRFATVSDPFGATGFTESVKNRALQGFSQTR
jgi:predicted enzyme related to lactoylglutathione lyase